MRPPAPTGWRSSSRPNPQSATSYEAGWQASRLTQPIAHGGVDEHPTDPPAHRDLALQREGAMGARAAPRPLLHVADPRARRLAHRRLDRDHPRARGTLPAATAVPGGPDRA